LWLTGVLALVLLSASVACGGRGDPSIRVLDFVHDFPRAEKRPGASAFEVAEHTLSSARRATIAAAVPSRIIFTTRVPARATLRADLAVLPAGTTADEGAVRFRIGISDGRIYEPLADSLIAVADTKRAGWTPLAVDMSLYGGRQWSLFYRPDRQTWQVILNADQVTGNTQALWGAPGLVTDRGSAERWFAEKR
jgi:hypothetical protein